MLHESRYGYLYCYIQLAHSENCENYHSTTASTACGAIVKQYHLFVHWLIILSTLVMLKLLVDMIGG